MNSTISAIRKEYKLQELDEQNVLQDPVKQFEKWWQDVLNSNIDEVNAMTLATVGSAGTPSARIVLLKGIDEKGFLFFTNYESQKGKALKENPSACLVFFWKELERQVRVEGIVEKLPGEESDEYFNSRPEGSRIGAWASPQSQVIPSREILEENFVGLSMKFTGQNIERPPHWGGYILKPSMVEFWQGRPNRMHDRIQYTMVEGKTWKIQRLAP
ncbi:MAG: pyridoxamine 5'-phosphate oxidase [Ferruginibacter sp.]